MPVTLDQFVQKLTGSGLMSASELSAFQGTLVDVPRDGGRSRSDWSQSKN
jgi:hypothetical protein